MRHDYDDRTVPADMLEQIRSFTGKVQQCPPSAYASQFGQALSSTGTAGGRVHGKGRVR
ncbi:hypothetical protein J2847_005834 [Azospirillum agricola]|uniref:hypothetical protein n=1 Tax=Azospirillum agricola TaxID=1720247 RepID=UPI001AE6DDB6|nr:hypothetical protein [Azospirillum agricola]MBP2232505.1 hypothetical protein [Azospirillum agricola]